jgi:hypothetical protein
MAKPAPTRPQRYQQLCREAARLLKVKASDPRVEHVATLRLARETFAAKLVSGQQVDPNVLLTLDGALRHYMPQEKLRVDIEVIEGPIEHCPKCGWHRDEPLPPSDPSPPTPLPTETKPSRPVPAVLNVVELPRRTASMTTRRDYRV